MSSSADADASLPGALPFPDDVARAIALARARATARPRTRHTTTTGAPRYTNRLVLESSPYLGQHAHNPVSWFPWGEEAFAVARATDRPIFLSVGYSTCHWCHVMEEESFEDEEIARFLNERFVAVKVDREERPDVDAIYMAAVQAMTGHGGWPMSVFLDHDRIPFYGGTYFPARDGDRGMRRGFLSILRHLDEAWRTKRDEISSGRDQVRDTLHELLSPGPPVDPQLVEVSARALRFYKARFDPRAGGLEGQTKFPSSLPVRFLLRIAHRTGDDDARAMARQTLDAMKDGGLHDHVGGGFHRYTVDPRWQVPHFEKMLYDNALLLATYAEAHQVFPDAGYRDVVDGIVAFVDREMTADDGTFYSATDADSLAPSGHREEGYFFTWTPDELSAELGAERAALVAAAYGVTARGNFEGRTVLTRVLGDEALAARFGPDPSDVRRALAEARATLLTARAERPAPLRDDKRLVAWNGLLIDALATAGRLLGELGFVARAARAARAILDVARRRGRLFRVLGRDGARIDALLDDHAALAGALVSLFESTGDPAFLDEARALDDEIARRFEDPAHGGFFTTPDDQEALLVREKAVHDGAEPSGASLHVDTLLRLATLTDDERLRARAARALAAVGGVLERAPHALNAALLAVERALVDPLEIVLSGPTDEALAPLAAVLVDTSVPHAVVVRVRDDNALALAARTPLARDRAPVAVARAFVCRGGVCALPSTDADALRRALADALTPRG